MPRVPPQPYSPAATSQVRDARVRDALMLVLTLAAAVTDAVSYLGLRQVFTANMTGNIVLLGVALAGANFVAAARSGVALAGFVAGVLATSALPWSRPGPKRSWPGLLAVVGAWEFAVLAVFAVVWNALSGRATPQVPLLFVLIGLSALAMGSQSATIARLGLPGVTTTYITGTLTGLVNDLVRGVRERGRLLRAGVLVVYLGGAVASGTVYLRWGSWVAVIPAVLVAAVTATLATLAARER